MKVLKFLLYIILGLAALVVALGIFGKKAYHLERTVTIKAPLSTVHEMVSHWSHFPAWSPWQQLDPNVVTKIDGKDGTAGAKFSWVGNKNAGEGSMTFTEVAQNKVAFDIAFVKPWKTAAPSAIAMQETPEGVQTTWAFDMHIPFPFNGFALFTDIDRGVGKDFADGLQRLKSLCETETRKLDNALSAITVVPVPNQTWLGFRKKIPMSEMEAFTTESFGKLYGGIAPTDISGAAASLYFVWDEANQITDLAIVVPVAKGAKLPVLAGAETFTTGGNAARAMHSGSYADLKYPHLALDKYLAGIGATPKEPVLEVYLNTPQTEKDPTKLQTEVYYFFAPTAK
jgi:effector-binding domain-containing protein/uncharacterized protein YndB with AHSA1/START domain